MAQKVKDFLTDAEMAQLEQSPMGHPAASEFISDAEMEKIDKTHATLKPRQPMGPAQPPTVADFHKPSLKSLLDVPLDIGIGMEQAAGIDPMRPIGSLLENLPSPKTPLLTVGKNLIEGIKGIPRGIGEAITSGGQALREGDLPGAAQAVGRGVAFGEAGKGIVKAGAALAKPVLKPMAGDLANKLYESALKPGPRSNSLADVQRMVKTGLDEGIPVSYGGTRKLSGLQNEINAKVGSTINNQAAPISKFDVARRLNDPAKRFALQVNPEADLDALSETGNEFLRNQPNDILPTDAQALKQGTYQQLNKRAYGELKSGSVEGQKTLARGLKEEIEARFPSVQGLNQRNSDLFHLQPELEAAVNRSTNHDIFGLGAPVVGAGVGMATGSLPQAALGGALMEIMRRPALKSRLAIALAKAAR